MVFPTEACKNWRNYVSDEYIRNTNDYFNGKEDSVISNDSMPHAVFLTYFLIDNSKKNIKIYQGILDELFYACEDVFNAFEMAVKERNVEVKILLQNIPQKEKFPKKLHELWRQYGGKIKIYEAVKPIHNSNINHFLLSDGVAYRSEKQHSEEEFLKGKVRASVNFGDKGTGNGIDDMFNSIKKEELSFCDYCLRIK